MLLDACMLMLMLMLTLTLTLTTAATQNNLTYGTVGAGQWDGAEFHMMGGWDLPHSKQTLNSGVFHMGGPSNNFPGLWGGAVTKTFGQAHALWDKKPAIEMSLLLPGLAPWRGDMTPFAVRFV